MFWPGPGIQDQILRSEWKTHSRSSRLQTSRESLVRHVWHVKGTMCAWVTGCWTGVEFGCHGCEGPTGFMVKPSALLLHIRWRHWITNVRWRREIWRHWSLWLWTSEHLLDEGNTNVPLGLFESNIYPSKSSCQCGLNCRGNKLLWLNQHGNKVRRWNQSSMGTLCVLSHLYYENLTITSIPVCTGSDFTL